MALKTVLDEVRRWPSEDRLNLIGMVWDDLSVDSPAPVPTDELNAVLEERIAELEAAPDDVSTWDEIVSHVNRPR